MSFCRVVAVVLTWLVLDALPRAEAEERAFALIFGAQAEPNLPRYSHTFATFVKTKDAPPADAPPAKAKLDVCTISWMPRRLDIQILSLRAEPGVNLDLAGSMQWARRVSARVTLWGPYEVQPELFEMAKRQADRLDSGAISYRAVDWRNRGIDASNCSHAVCDLDTTRARLITGSSYGNAASLKVLQHLSPHFLPSQKDHSWLIERLDLKNGDLRHIPPVASSGE